MHVIYFGEESVPLQKGRAVQRQQPCNKHHDNIAVLAVEVGHHDNIAVLAVEVGAHYLQETQQRSTPVGRNIEY